MLAELSSFLTLATADATVVIRLDPGNRGSDSSVASLSDTGEDALF
jgi:hypothetical protein